ncbi:hypothetical protein, conserved [Eimeria praecox]|uniref:Transmembrane protein n=1 Tax=Eimeria praecox TaxID=51316 RepID=U6H2Z8_9EIME|nr:hypothetical protein, conserved [Eimeria praecox]
MLTGPSASVSPHCRAGRSGHETAVIDLPVRIAMGGSQRLLGIGPVVRHLLLVLLMLQLLFLADGSSTAVASGGSSALGVAIASDAEGTHVDKPAVQDGIGLRGGAGAKSPTASAGGGVVSDEHREKGNLERLRTLMVEADASETEKLSDTRYFLGVMSEKIKRHFLADLLSVILLFAGYYVLAAGLERRPTQKTSSKASRV